MQFRITSLLLPLTVVCMAGCASSNEPKRAMVTAEDFVGSGVPPAPVRAAPPRLEPAEVARGGVEDVTVVIGAPDPDEDAATGPTTSRVVIDELVGQINGVPIYAGEFFAASADRWRSESRLKPYREWVGELQEEVARQLIDQMRDALYLSEYNANLKPEQRQGLLVFLEELRSNLRRQYGGSGELANERLLEADQMTLDQKAQDMLEQGIVREQIRRKIYDRVHVSRRDIELYYRRNFDEFNPPPIAVMRVILVPLSDTDRVDRVEAALAAGERFVEIAREESRWKPNEGNLQEVVVTGGDYRTHNLWNPNTPLNAATQALRPGEHTGKLEHSNMAYWILLEEIREPTTLTLYEAQALIEERLRTERFQDEQKKYLTGLARNANMSDMDETTQRLVEYAVRQFWLPGPGSTTQR
jgi:hypothetical protein